MKLDKFYTQPEVAKQCYDFLCQHYNLTNKTFLEPSAGAGVFSLLLSNCLALDIAPEGDNIIKQNFLTFNTDKTDYITIGNPPFGSRSDMAIRFFNHAAGMSEIIAFILPVSFMKWSVQKQLNNNFALTEYFYLPFEAFTANNKPFGVRTVFQIWVNKNSSLYKGIDNRLKKQPPIKHEDFDIWQYNATEGAIKYIDEPWEIATYRQGYHDYNQLFFQKDYNFIKEKMTGERKQQFFFIKPKTAQAKEIILQMDFNALAERNTSTPGFGKGDFVNYYIECKNNLKFL